ncbi:MAG: hypothetical protein GWO04_14370 [Actinobacteria bacterium]|nr:hypothetical protein [Actinomycetota bacterium]NIS31047.1 hypothetical protein [Actinomycetota bacterium]NIW28025.1 hypothetical protein [Actinomycetota bacterium]
MATAVVAVSVSVPYSVTPVASVMVAVRPTTPEPAVREPQKALTTSPASTGKLK